MLLGSSTVQVCTGAMLQGYKMVSKLEEGVGQFMQKHGFKNLRDFIGKSLDAFTTHADLVERQRAAKAGLSGATNKDAETWKGDIANETDALTANK